MTIQEYIFGNYYNHKPKAERKLLLNKRELKKLEKEVNIKGNAIIPTRLFINDRRTHVENSIKPALQEKKIVILDRYYFSTIAYQGAIGLDPIEIKKENELFCPIPEIVFLLTIPPRVGIRRIQKSKKTKTSS